MCARDQLLSGKSSAYFTVLRVVLGQHNYPDFFPTVSRPCGSRKLRSGPIDTIRNGLIVSSLCKRDVMTSGISTGYFTAHSQPQARALKGESEHHLSTMLRIIDALCLYILHTHSKYSRAQKFGIYFLGFT